MQFGLIEAIRHWGKYRGTKAAFISNGQATTYRDLFLRAEQVAQAIGDFGAEGRVAVAALHKAGFVVMLLGVMRAGNPAVVLNTHLGDEALSVTISDTMPDVLLQDSDLAGTCFPKALTSVPRVTVGGFQGGVSRNTPWPKYSSSSEWGVLFSSGSTGVPKGVERDHNSMITEIVGWCLELPLTKHSVFYIGRPLFYTGGLVLVLATLFVGGTVIANDYQDDDDPAEVWSDYQMTLSAHSVEWTFFVPDQVRAFVAANPTDHEHSKSILVMGAPISGDEKLAARTVLASQIVESWGNSESLGTITEPEDLDLRPESVGRPFLTDELDVIDDSFNPCEPGKVGRIAGGDTAGFQGYSNHPDATKQVKTRSMIISDDLGYTDSNGYFYVSGRLQDHVVRGGASLYLPTVATKIRAHPDIAEVEVCAITNGDAIHLCAAVVLTPVTTTNAEGLCATVNVGLDDQEQLLRILVLDALPKLASGKTDRLAVRGLLEDRG